MTLSIDQQAIRRTCVTASEVAAIVGLHPYRAPIDAWAWLVHGITPIDNDYMRWGRMLEPIIRDDYAERHGMRVEVPGTLLAPDDDRHGATPDGLAYRWGQADPDEGIEIKVHESYARPAYGQPGTDDVPAHELIQCIWNQRVTGIDRWRLIVSLGGPPVEYIIDRDRDLEAELADVVNEFWQSYVETRNAPPPDGSDGYTAWLKRLRPADERKVLPLDDVREEIAELRDARKVLARAERDDARAQQQVQARMGEATDIETEDGRVTWRPRKDGVRVFRVPDKWTKENF